jgi:hypothetical protein
VNVVKEDGTAPVLLSAYEDFARLTRVRDVALRLSLATLQKLHRLHDHKGDLSVVWHALPAGSDIAAVQQAWETECEFLTSHFFDEQPLLDNGTNYPPSGNVTVISGMPGATEKTAPTPSADARLHLLRNKS